MPEIRSYRDEPKRGENDAKWCAYMINDNGHITLPATIGHETEAEAREAMGRAAYEADRARRPAYHDGQPRKEWHELDAIARHSWTR